MAGYASVLLQISRCKTLDPSQFQLDINHAAAIQFGTVVKLHWKYSNKRKHPEEELKVGQETGRIILGELDKHFVRDNIMQSIYE